MLTPFAVLWLATAPAAGSPPVQAPPPPPPALSAPDLLGAVFFRLGEVEVRRVADAHPELDAAAEARLTRAGEAVVAEGANAIARSYEELLSRTFTPERRRALTTFFDSDAGRAFTAAFLGGLKGISDAESVTHLRERVSAGVCAEAKVCSSDRGR